MPSIWAAALSISVACALDLSALQQPGSTDWPSYGRDPGGSRFSPLRQIAPENVARLQVAWTYHTGELKPEFNSRSAGNRSLEVTPIVVDGVMYVSTPLGRVIALDPITGAERWSFDPKVNRDLTFGDYTSRGVATWLDRTAATRAVCRRRIIAPVIDARLVALDAATGKPCAPFGRAGTIDLRAGLRNAPFETEEYELTSPPAIIGDVIVVGSAVADNNRVDAASGEVRAFDARTGRLLWSWDPVPQNARDPAYASWSGPIAHTTGAANAWSVMVADTASGLVFVPTGSPSPDYFGGHRLGDNRYGNSIVALHARTGQVAWHFQTVHHDLWDYDNGSPPLLTTVRRNNRTIPVVLLATKTGMLFVLERATGRPVFRVEERRVPASTIPGERASPTQPFAVGMAPLSPHQLRERDVWGASPADRADCLEQIRPLRNEGIFTPPSLEGTLALPSNIGGAHWGGVAVDSDRRIALVPVNRIATMVQLIPNERFNPAEARQSFQRYGDQYTQMRGTPYIMRRRFLLSRNGYPCTPPPFGSLVAVNLDSGRRLWEVPLGSYAPPGGRSFAGSINLGGPITTASGLTFIAASLDQRFRAFETTTGKELWSAALPAGGKATPMTYLGTDGRQYVVIAAGGGGRFGPGDAIVAFALPR
ncbi:MAG: pyrroloquinoline quinone-dependent dehydrogenase [Longimicrobiales bacterium]